MDQLPGALYRRGYEWDSDAYRRLLEALKVNELTETFSAIESDDRHAKTLVQNVYPNEKQSDQRKYRDSLINFMKKYQTEIKSDLSGSTVDDIVAPEMKMKLAMVSKVVSWIVSHGHSRDRDDINAYVNEERQFPLETRKRIASENEVNFREVNRLLTDKWSPIAQLLKTELEESSADSSGKRQQQPSTTDAAARRRSARIRSMAQQPDLEKILSPLVDSDNSDKLRVAEIPGKGRGIVAAKPIGKSEFLLEYSGSFIESEEAKKREEHYSHEEAIGCYMFWFKYLNSTYCVDATEETGRLGRLINHSRKNGNVKPVVAYVRGQPRIFFQSKKDIENDEELTYDYGDRRQAVVANMEWLKH